VKRAKDKIDKKYAENTEKKRIKIIQAFIAGSGAEEPTFAAMKESQDYVIASLGAQPGDEEKWKTLFNTELAHRARKLAFRKEYEGHMKKERIKFIQAFIAGSGAEEPTFAAMKVSSEYADVTRGAPPGDEEEWENLFNTELAHRGSADCGLFDSCPPANEMDGLRMMAAELQWPCSQKSISFFDECDELRELDKLRAELNRLPYGSPKRQPLKDKVRELVTKIQASNPKDIKVKSAKL